MWNPNFFQNINDNSLIQIFFSLEHFLGLWENQGFQFFLLWSSKSELQEIFFVEVWTKFTLKRGEILHQNEFLVLVNKTHIKKRRNLTLDWVSSWQILSKVSLFVSLSGLIEIFWDPDFEGFLRLILKNHNKKNLDSWFSHCSERPSGLKNISIKSIESYIRMSF